MLRANIGCGSIQPSGWINIDVGTDGAHQWDVRYTSYACDLGLGKHRPGPARECPPTGPVFDYAVCSFMLQELNHHEIPGALANMMAILKPGGTLRILVPHLMRAFRFFNDKQEEWFPQDERTGDLDAKFCTYVTWFGTVRSVFTPSYLGSFLRPLGATHWVSYGETVSNHPEIVELDSRENEALVLEVTKP